MSDDLVACGDAHHTRARHISLRDRLSQVSFLPLQGKADMAPPEGDAAPPSRDMIQVQESLIVLKSQPIELTGGRPAREYIYSYRLTSAMARGGEKWKRATIRSSIGAGVFPPPYRRQCHTYETKMLMMCHGDQEQEEEGELVTSSTRAHAHTPMHARPCTSDDAQAMCARAAACHVCSTCMW